MGSVAWESNGKGTIRRQKNEDYGVDGLDSRRLLSVVPQSVLDAGFEPIEWRGETVYAKPGQWLLQLNGVVGAPDAQLAKANGQLGRVNAAIKATKHLGRDGLVLVDAPRDLAHGKLKQIFGALGNLDYFEPDAALWTSTTTPNDPRYCTDLWGMNNTGQTGGTPDADIDAPEAWDIARGDGSVVVGVIDSGIDYKHPDLAGNIWVNPAEIAGNRKDDDGNGYVDDIHGWDFINNDKDPMDDHGHGTHVAGTIAGAGNNGVGVVGVNWNAKVMALKFLGANGSGPWSAAIAAINYATNMNSRGINIKVTNNSYTGWSESQGLYDAIKRNGDAGMMFVAAAGNDGSNIDGGGVLPAAYNLPNIISVAATDHNDALATFSNYGTVNVDLAAPGVSILSTLPGNAYAAKNGTSMAAPHVAGVAAVAWSYSPGASFEQVRSALLAGADHVATLDGKVFSGARLNAVGTLAHVNDPYVAPAAPDAPTELTAAASWFTRTDGSTIPIITLNWVPSASPELQRYDVYCSTEGGEFVRITTLPAGASSYRSGGLTGTSYAYRITASNYLFTSDPSNTAEATTPGEKVTIPTPPSNLIATAVSKTEVRLTWSDNSDDELAFRIERSTDGIQWSYLREVGANVTTYANVNLKRNVTYYYRVQAYNVAGSSAFSNTGSAKTSAASSDLLVRSGSIFSNRSIIPPSLGATEAQEKGETIDEAEWAGEELVSL